MLAYLFWHRPVEGTPTDSYEISQGRLHRSLAARPPEGFRGSAMYRAPQLPWLDTDSAPARPARPGYEDWYLVDDWAALGVLRQAAVSGGHRTAHDEAARHAGPATGGVYRLDEGEARPAAVRQAVWVTPARHRPDHEPAALLLGDGMDRERAALWRRELNLGPAPEYCLLATEVPAGVGEGRLPEGWTATVQPRHPVYAAERLLG